MHPASHFLSPDLRVWILSQQHKEQQQCFVGIAWIAPGI